MPYKNENHRQNGRIRLTYCVSPHEFWFKYIDDEKDPRDYEIREKVQRFGEAMKDWGKHSPSTGDLVVVRRLCSDKEQYVRARVDCRLKQATTSELVLWAIDEGYPIRSSDKWIAPLTVEDLRNENSLLFKGTLNQIVPATAHFDSLEKKSVLVKADSWSEQAIKEFKQRTSNGQSLIFHYDCHTSIQHLWGSLEVVSSTMQSVNMNDILKDLQVAVDATGFEREYQHLARRDYWLLDPVQNYKIRKHIQPDVKALQPKEFPFVNTVRKVETNAVHGKNLKVRNMNANTMSKINSWISQRSMSIRNADSDTECETFEDCQFDATVSETDVISAAASVESLAESFYSVHSVDQYKQSFISKNNLKKAFQMDSCTTPNQAANRVLIHCGLGVAVRPISSLIEADFLPEINDRLKPLKITEVHGIQAIVWPHLMRRRSLALVNGAKTGKTWTFLPAVCSLLLDSHYDRVDSYGPIVTIVCLDTCAVNEMVKYLKKLLPNWVICEAFTKHNAEDFQYTMLNGIDILCTHVPCLLQLIENDLGLFNKKRMTTIVFDEIDAMCDRFGEKAVQIIYKALCESAHVQTIVTSKTWRKIVKKFCAKDDLLLCVGGYIEVAIYSSVELNVFSTNEANHYRDFLSFLRSGNYSEEATVVVCNKTEDVFAIKNLFHREGYNLNCTYCYDRTDVETLAAINRQIFMSPSSLGVIVCTDVTLAALCIRNAQHIIHFTVPEDWAIFTQRFVASFDYYENMVGNGLSPGQPTSAVFLDEQSCGSMPRLVEFMKTRCFADVPERVLKLAALKQNRRERESLRQGKPFCSTMMLMGDCNNKYDCASRHVLAKSDQTNRWMPHSGEIKFEILTVHSPVHFTVHLLGHRSTPKSEWQIMCRVDEYAAYQMRFTAFFKENELEVHDPIRIGDLCVIDSEETCISNEAFARCEVIGIDDEKSQITVLLIDSNETVTISKNVEELYVLPDEFKKFPPQAVDIRIAGVVPVDLSVNWDKNLIKVVKLWLSEYKNFKSKAFVELALMKCIWVKSVELFDFLSIIREEVVRFDVTMEIVRQNLGIVNPNWLHNLRRLAGKAGILDTEPYSPPAQLPSITPSMLKNDQNDATDSFNSTAVASKERWAVLLPDKFNEVDLGEFYTPDRIYVLLASEFTSFHKLREEILDFTLEPNNLKPLANVEVDQLCLANFREENRYDDYRRAQILKIVENEVKIFLVDYGVEEYVARGDLIEIPEEIIERLPFQAILCKMIGIRPCNDAKEWSDSVCQSIYESVDYCSNLFVKFAGKGSLSNDNLKCNAYDVLFVDKQLKENLNQFAVTKKLAEIDPRTIDFVEANIDWDSCDEANCSAGEFHFENIENLEDWDFQYTPDQMKKSMGIQIPLERNVESRLRCIEAAKVSECADGRIAGEVDKFIESTKLQLILPYKVPYITWQQTPYTVTATISAPDVQEYSLMIGLRYVHFCFFIDHERYESILNLFGCVDAKSVSHEIRGLNIVVRLKKIIAGMQWPQLEQSSEKNRFIKCTDDYTESDEEFDNDLMAQSHILDSGDYDSFEDVSEESDADIADIEYA